jgi:hypothetical protein
MEEDIKQTVTNHITSWIARSSIKSYRLLFGWLDARIAIRQERKFAQDVRTGLSSIFEKFGAEIVPHEGLRFPPPFDYAVVTIAISHLFLRFVRGQGDFRILVAAKGQIHDWRDWKDISQVRQVLDESKEREQNIRLRNVDDADRLLQTEIPRLLEVTCDEQWDLVKRKANALFPSPVRVR